MINEFKNAIRLTVTLFFLAFDLGDTPMKKLISIECRHVHVSNTANRHRLQAEKYQKLES